MTHYTVILHFKCTIYTFYSQKLEKEIVEHSSILRKRMTKNRIINLSSRSLQTKTYILNTQKEKLKSIWKPATVKLYRNTYHELRCEKDVMKCWAELPGCHIKDRSFCSHLISSIQSSPKPSHWQSCHFLLGPLK